jgi:hypothetical protein
MDASLGEMKAWRKETMVCQEGMTACWEKNEAYLERKEPAPAEMMIVTVHPESHIEEATVETIGALEGRYGDRHVAVGRRRKPEKWTQGGGGSRKKLAAASRRMTRHAVPAPRKGHGHQGSGKYDVVGTPKGRTFEKRRAQPKCSSGIWDQNLKQQVRLRSKMAFIKTVGQTHELAVENEC